MNSNIPRMVNGRMPYVLLFRAAPSDKHLTEWIRFYDSPAKAHADALEIIVQQFGPEARLHSVKPWYGPIDPSMCQSAEE